MLHAFSYLAPESRSDLLAVLEERSGAARLLAGGTDLLVNIRNGLMKPEYVINLKRVADFGPIEFSKTAGLRIGPTVTINDVLRDANVRKHFPLLAVCAHDLASYQIRNRATVVGNVVNASPCSDMAPALLCLEARAVLTSTRGSREVPFKEFFTGVKRTVLAPDELLETIVVPASSAGARGSYHKLKRINGHDLGIVGVALLKKDGAMRLGISSAAPTPVLVGDFKESEKADTVIAAALKAISPISDVRCSKEYREYMVTVYIRRLLEEVK
ncbi:FAD binding domain-containing protein [Salinispira pacifica]